jgi:uncharacterized membrane protein (UPF0182 family)
MISSVSDHFAALLAVGLVLAFVLGTLAAQLMRSVRSMYTAQDLLKAATATMRAARLRFVFLAAIIFAIAWPYIHGA